MLCFPEPSSSSCCSSIGPVWILVSVGVSSPQLSVLVAFFSLFVHLSSTHSNRHKLTSFLRRSHADHVFLLRHLLSVCVLGASVPDASVAADDGRMMKALRCKWSLNYCGQSVGACAGRADRPPTRGPPHSRALQWLVKTPSRALGFELAFCQASCQREAGPLTDRVCVCVLICSAVRRS